jgi:hypothetical protein
MKEEETAETTLLRVTGDIKYFSCFPELVFNFGDENVPCEKSFNVFFIL